MHQNKMTPAQYADFMANHAKMGKRVNARKKFFEGQRQETVPDNAFAIQINIMDGKETDPNVINQSSTQAQTNDVASVRNLFHSLFQLPLDS